MGLEHDIAIVSNAFYVGELAAGLRSCERILSNKVDPQVEQLTLRNRVFYMRTLQDLVGSEYVQMKTEPAHSGWSLFNPSIYKMNDERLVILLRSSNYQYNRGQYIMPPEDKNVIKTESILCELDDSLTITKANIIKEAKYPKNGYPVEGIEDARLFEAGGTLWVSGTARNCAPFDGACRILLAELNESTYSFERPEVVTSHITRHEKNWSPILGKENPTWLYSCGLDQTTKLHTKIGNRLYEGYHNAVHPLYEKFRGGSQLIPYESGYLTIIHEVAIFETGRVYSHRFVRFNETCEIIGYSIPFFIRTPQVIEFAAGMTIYKDHLLISFGHMDESAWVAKIPLNAVKQLI